MFSVKKIILKLISFGTYPQMDENKKIAIQIANFDGIASLITFIFYFFYTWRSGAFPVVYFHLSAAILCSYGVYLLKSRNYNSGRILIFFVGLAEIFLSVDGVKANSGFEFYYFAPLIVPFVVFTPEELTKSIILSLCGFFVFIIQQLCGPGIFSQAMEVSAGDRVITIGILFIYVISLFSISRWQMNSAQRKIKSQQSELIHISNIAALGEMSGGIAHEINNPLQILSSQVSMLKKQLAGITEVQPKIIENLSSMEKTILRISKLVRGLKNLSRNVTTDPQTIFPLSAAIEDMLAVSKQKLKHMEISLEIKGDVELKVSGHIVQLSQVLINLLNNSVDAIDESTDNKWVTIEVSSEAHKVIIAVTDSGPGISKEIVQKIMHPFFTTKAPGRGTGLGLSISSSMIEKINGRLYYDSTSPHTRFVIELPSPNSESELTV